MKRYEIIKAQKEIAYKNRMSIKQGCTLDDCGGQIVNSFENLEDANVAFKGLKLKSDIWYNGNVYLVIEYAIQCNEYDADGDFITGGDILGISTMKIDAVNSETLETMASFDNMADAENFYDDNIDNIEMYLSFCQAQEVKKMDIKEIETLTPFSEMELIGIDNAEDVY